MGYVYRAEHVKLGREVALKLLRSDYAKRRDAVARFFQEARTVNRIRHRNIVDVTDFVELDDGTTFIIMEFLRGKSLGKWARTGVDLPRALAVLVQICDGLARRARGRRRPPRSQARQRRSSCRRPTVPSSSSCSTSASRSCSTATTRTSASRPQPAR